MKYSGTFWSRTWESDTDLEEELGRGDLDSGLRYAFADVCLMVEPVSAGFGKGSLAVVEIFGEDGNFKLMASCQGRSASVTTCKCPRCGVDTYENCHSFNGCEVVLIEEIMER